MPPYFFFKCESSNTFRCRSPLWSSRRLRDWEERGVWLKIWRTFLSELNERQQLKWSESFLDGSFAPAKKNGYGVGKTKRGKEV